MDELSTLQSRVDALLAVPIAQPSARAAATIAPQVATEGVAATPRQRFSPFISAQLQRATALARSFAALADSKEGTEGLSAAKDLCPTSNGCCTSSGPASVFIVVPFGSRQRYSSAP